MKLEKRDGGGEEQQPREAPKPSQNTAKQKPVFLYIFILFVVAFSLILMSFFMHQRSNEQVLGELHNNVNAIEQLQDAVDENLRLEKALKQAQTELETAKSQLEQDTTKDDAECVAMLLLYQLQQEYAGRQLEACQVTIAALEQGPAQDLPTESPATGVVSPAERFAQLRDAVNAAVADEEEKAN